MHPRHFFAAGALAVLLPLTASALTTDELKQQIADLLVQLAALQEQIKALSAASPAGPAPAAQAASRACSAPSRTLGFGARGSDVAALQRFLVSQGFFDADSATGYFGPATEAAVQKWQTKNGIVSSGDARSTGWGVIGARTRAAMRNQCSDGISGTFSVSATRLSVSVDATVNTKHTCNAAAYTLDFGDGSPVENISVPAGACNELKQTFAHTYAKVGGYVITLGSGSSSASLHVAVTAPPPASTSTSTADSSSCATPEFALGNAPGGVIGVPWTLPLLSAPVGADAPTLSAINLPLGIALQDQISATTTSGLRYHNWTLTGTPLGAGTYYTVITAKNECGSTALSTSLNVISAVPSSSQCVPKPAPPCGQGTLSWLGNDGNGCSMGYQCLAKKTSCPVYNAPLCAEEYELQGSGTDSNGCTLPPKCVAL